MILRNLSVIFLILLVFSSLLKAEGPKSSCSKTGICVAPVAITTLTATQGTQSGKVTLTWAADPYATGYEVWRSNTISDQSMKIATLTAPVSSYEDSSVIGVASYYYTVKTIIAPLTGLASNRVYGWAKEVCGSPIISSFTLPLINVPQSTQIESRATFSFPDCSINGMIRVDMIDSDGALIAAGTDVATATGSDLTESFFSKGIKTPGSYTFRMTARSDSGIAIKAASLTVNAVNLPTLTVVPGFGITIGEETVTATLSNPTVVNCPFTSNVNEAIADSSKCYLTFTTPPAGMTLDNSGTLPSLSGTLESVGSFSITAEIHKFNGAELVKIGQVSKTVTTSCSAPTISTLAIPSLLPYELPTYAATYKAYSCNGPMSGTLTISQDSTVIESKALSSLDYGAAINLMAAGTGLPAGNYTATLSITGASGTANKVQSFSVKTVPMPYLTTSPTMVSKSETKFEARLIPPTDTTCPLTTDIALAQTDSKRCYVELTSTVPDLVAGTDTRGLPILTGYPATAGDYTAQVVVSRWVSGIRYDSEPLTKTVNVNALDASSFGFIGKTSVYVDIENVSLIFKQLSGRTCRLFVDQSTAQNEAMKGKRACFAKFTGDTNLRKTYSLNQFKFEGSFTTIGTQTLFYTVKRVFADGSVTELESGDFLITVINKRAPIVILKGGYKILDGQYYVQLGQAITRAKITAGVPTNAKMKIIITDGDKTLERSNLMNDSSYWVLTPPLKLMKTRLITLRVTWQDYPEVYTEQSITVVGGTENNMKLVMDAPAQIADTENMNVKVKLGKYTKNGIK